MQHFDSGLGLEKDMFTQIDLCETALPKQSNQVILTKFLAYTVRHLLSFSSLRAFVTTCSFRWPSTRRYTFYPTNQCMKCICKIRMTKVYPCIQFKKIVYIDGLRVRKKHRNN